MSRWSRLENQPHLNLGHCNKGRAPTKGVGLAFVVLEQWMRADSQTWMFSFIITTLGYCLGSPWAWTKIIHPCQWQLHNLYAIFIILVIQNKWLLEINKKRTCISIIKNSQMQREIWVFSQLTLFFHIKERKNSVDKMLKLSVALSTLVTNWNIVVNKYSK